MIELTLKVSNSEKSLRKKFMWDKGDLLLSPDNELLKDMVSEAVKEFQADVDDVLITSRMTW